MDVDEYTKKLKAEGKLDKYAAERGHCADCGGYPAFIPRVHVANMVTGQADRYLLQLPYLCNDCVAGRGLTRHGILVPKTKELQNFTEATKEFLARLPAWVTLMQNNSIKELMDQGLSEQDAKDMLGVE